MNILLRSDNGISIPTRSTLFPLEPFGIGTPDVESLSSYFLRLSEAHCVKPDTLYHLVIRPVMCELSGDPLPESPIGSSVLTVGLHRKFLLEDDGYAALDHLTQLNVLSHLTFVPWKLKISLYSLLRYKRAWCPVCYQEWDDKGQTIYDKLIWNIPEVKICGKHLSPLATRCPHPGCSAETPPLERSTRAGFCSKCRGWLGSYSSAGQSPLTDKETKTQLWIIKQVGQLLVMSSSGKLSMPIEINYSRGSNAFQPFITYCYGKNLDHFSKDFSIEGKRSQELLHKNAIPTLAELLKLSHATLIPLAVLCTEDVWLSLVDELPMVPEFIKGLSRQKNVNKLKREIKQATRKKVHSRPSLKYSDPASYLKYIGIIIYNAFCNIAHAKR